MVSCKNLTDHLQAVHGKELTTYDDGNCFVGNLDAHESSVHWTSVESRDFFVMKKITPTGHLHCWIFGVGTKEEMANFDYAIQLKNKDNSTEISWREPVISVDKSTEDVLIDEDGLILTKKAIARLLMQGPIIVAVTIYKRNA